jgi:hypothetical protein
MATNLLLQLPSYAYQQYSDDPDIVAFFTAYNNFSQANLDTINVLSLPNYQSKSLILLDWVAENLYGQKRKDLPVGSSKISGPLNTYEYNEKEPNQYDVLFAGSSFAVSDGVFKSIIQWNNFKGDGYQFTIRWLKKRVRRFLNGNPFIEQTYDVSVVFIAPNDVQILIPAISTYGPVFKAAVESAVVLLPFQYSFTVVLV